MLVDLCIYTKINDKRCTLFSFNFKEDKLNVIGGFGDTDKTFICLYFANSLTLRHPKSTPPLSDWYLQMIGTIHEPNFFNEIPEEFSSPRIVKTSYKNTIYPRFFLHLAYTNTIIIEAQQMADFVLYPKTYIVTALSVSCHNIIQSKFLQWIQEFFPKLKLFYLMKSLENLMWEGDFQSMERLYMPTKNQAFLNKFIKSCPRIRIVFTPLDGEDLQTMQEDHPSVQFLPYSFTESPDLEDTQSLGFCQHN
ncbi:hypothetical protein DSO57_1023526 [Entomophthora muscae]|uniref:Uncharacterized protein n=1 Tax=Entomophthora muscae TaxID=34485 RepID=A0ACC2UMR8_9FUNG|nr:hypothetical protein DSO57_1023526 [Entomophthora muscae]